MKTEELTAALAKLSVFLQKLTEAQVKQQQHKGTSSQGQDVSISETKFQSLLFMESGMSKQLYLTNIVIIQSSLNICGFNYSRGSLTL